MTWVLTHHGVVVARGSYRQMLEAAAARDVLAREWHEDGTELAPRWTDRWWTIVPVASAARGRAA